jgi:hypothetical protein
MTHVQYDSKSRIVLHQVPEYLDCAQGHRLLVTEEDRVLRQQIAHQVLVYELGARRWEHVGLCKHLCQRKLLPFVAIRRCMHIHAYVRMYVYMYVCVYEKILCMVYVCIYIHVYT